MNPLFIFLPNPFDPNSAVQARMPAGTTPNQWKLLRKIPDAMQLGPVICLKNNEPILRKDWDTPTEDGDVVTFAPVVTDPVLIVIAVVVVVVAVAVVLTVSSAQVSNPNTPSFGDIGEPDPVFSLRGQQNKNKLGNPIERIYGRVRTWPSYAATPFTKFIDNDAFLYQLFCLGHGEINVESILIEDTPIEQFQDVEYQLVPPGGVVTLFPDNVFTSTEVGNIELFGENEPEYTGITPGYVACPPLSTTTEIECDVLLPQGLYYANDGGGLDTRTVSFEFQARMIDDNGNPTTPWTVKASITKTLATNTPQRFTVPLTVDQGRWEVRARRTNNADTSHRAGDTVVWNALRAFLPSVTSYPGVTMLAVSARASNNLNDSASNRINVVGTAKLPIWSPAGGWSAPQVTRSAVWAFCDVFRASYGGNLPSEFLDLEALHALDQVLESRQMFFDWVFETKGSTWEAARTIATCVRCAPMLNGSKITLIPDEPKTLPVALFNENNIVANSLSWDVKLRDPHDYTGLEITYTNANTWQPESVLCLAPGDDNTNVKEVKLPGCTDRNHAYRIGMYMRMSELALRTNVSFKTGMNGLVIRYGDLIAVSHQFPKWGQSGEVLSLGPSNTINLSPPVSFGAGEHFLLIRKRDGSVLGPLAVTEVSEGTVQASTSVSSDIFFGTERPVFLFGKQSRWGRSVRVMELRPDAGEEVYVKALDYSDAVFSYDDATAPALSVTSAPPLDGAPAVQGLKVRVHTSGVSQVVVTWLAVPGGQVSYVLRTSEDGISFTTIATLRDTFYILPVIPGELTISVQAVRSGAGVPAVWRGLVGTSRPVPLNVAGLAVTSAFTGLSLNVAWTPLTDIDRYQVRVMTEVGGVFKVARTQLVEDPEFNYSSSDAATDGIVGRNIKLLVVGVNVTGESPVPATLTEDNPVPNAPTGLASALVPSADTSTTRRFALSWSSSETDIHKFRVSWSPVSAGDSWNVVYEGSALSCLVDMPLVNIITYPFDPIMIPVPRLGTAEFYWRVEAIDVWGPEAIASIEDHQAQTLI